MQIPQLLSDLFETWAGEKPDLVLPFAPSGSKRIYYQLESENKKAVGAYYENRKENEAFIGFSKHFWQKGLPVPQIYAEDLDKNIYLQEDLGATTLYSYLLQKGNGFPDYLIKLYKKVVEKLAYIQIEGGDGLNFDLCYPRKEFDLQSMQWDFNTFKYYFLKLSDIRFDEAELEKDFITFAKYISQADTSHFMFRDFQTRNIMIKHGKPYFIDYQGGRKGAKQYDLASLLFQAKANIPHDIRKQLLDHYLNTVKTLIDIDEKKFVEYYYGYVLMRNIQVFGTYGLRGLYERKEHFLKSIPFAINNLKWLLENVEFKVKIPELKKALYAITVSEKFIPFDRNIGKESLLVVRVTSFSYKNGIPEDHSGHGGGFVFDCRSINNPGRYEPYKKLTGKDEPVINFLKQHSIIDEFLNNIYYIVDEAIENYLERSFTHLSVNFGCTGGKHRSVYSADAFAKHVEEKYGVKVILQHIEMERRGWV